MSTRTEKHVAFYIAGMNDEERRALAVALYFARVPNPNGDDTDQINTYAEALDKIAEQA